jgi:endonuclease YncB( thermonuclease family)
MRYWVFSLLFVTLALAMVPPAVAAETEITAKPAGIVDGDTFVIRFRSQGIDTPEKKQLCENADGACYACGQEAKKALLRMIRFRNSRGR